MKQYPTVPGEIMRSQPIYAFDKLDGSNVRAEWSKKRGFYKFGSRKRLLDASDLLLGEAVQLITDKYATDLEKVFKKERLQKAVCFFEFYGPNSFAGFHEETDTKTVTLIDAALDKKGILEPKDFLKKFGHLDIPKLLYHGKANSDLVEAVKSGTLEGMTFEGVVCKGKYKSPGLPWMFKVKNVAWIQKLKEIHADRFEELL